MYMPPIHTHYNFLYHLLSSRSCLQVPISFAYEPLILPHPFYPVTLPPRGSNFCERWVEVIWFCGTPVLVRLLVGLVVGWLNVNFVLPERLCNDISQTCKRVGPSYLIKRLIRPEDQNRYKQ